MAECKDCGRKADAPVDTLFLCRTSPRAMSGEGFTEEEVNTLLEAARWAPSAYNLQPWRLIYATPDKKEAWEKVFGVLVDFNKMWCKNAGLLVIYTSVNKTDKGPNNSHTYDTGSAWMSMALQAKLKGWVAHGMSGFDYGKVNEIWNLPDDVTVDAMAAFGKPGRVEDLPEPLQGMEKQASGRIPVKEFARLG